MKKGSSRSWPYVNVLFGIAVFAGLYLSSLYSYLLFHSLAEFFSIAVACGIFMLVWNSRRFLENHYFLFIGIAYLFVAGLDMAHTLAYVGMDIFKGYGANLPTQLWISARYMQSISLVIAPFFIGRRLKSYAVLASYALATAMLLLVIFYWGTFPEAYAEGVGLTRFKIASEYIISATLLAAGYLHYRYRRAFDRRVLWLVYGSIGSTIVSELSFTFYINVYGISNLIGHFLKIVAFYLIYKAVVETGLMKPYDLLFRSLKESERELKESEKRYRTLVNDTPAMICRFLPDGELTFVNDYYCKYFDKGKEELVGYNFFGFIPEGEKKMVRDHFMALTKENPMVTYEHQVISSDGSLRWQSWTDRALFDESGELSEYQSLGIDITEHKSAEAEIIRYQERLEDLVIERTNELIRTHEQLLQSQKMDAVGQLAGGIAHDFNNRLSAIVNYAFVLKNALAGNEELRVNAEKILLSCERAATLVRKLLTFSRKKLIDPRPVNINMVVQDVEDLIARLLGEDIELDIKLLNEPLVVKADTVQMEHVIINLVTNARDAMPGGGCITIRTGRGNCDELAHELGGDRPASCAVLSISDTGLGMDEETRVKIFEPFFTLKEIDKGTGLGLSMVYGIIKQHGGHIDVKSAAGGGTTFTIYLPLLGSERHQPSA